MNQFESARAFEAAGYSSKQAETLIVHIEQTIDNRVATKADMAETHAFVKVMTGELRRDLVEMRGNFTTQLLQAESRLRWLILAVVLTTYGIPALLKHFG